MVKCSKCGIESEIEQAFKKEHSWLKNETRYYCPSCQSERVSHDFLDTVRWVVIGGVIGYLFSLVLPGGLGGHLARFLVDLCGFVLVMLPMVVVHELAHAGVASLVGLRVFAVFIGFGKTIYKRRLAGVDWEIKAMPLAGATVISSPEVPFFRLKMFLAILAGPAVHALVAAAALVLNGGMSLLQVSYSPFNWLLNNLAFANLVLLVSNLIPQQVSTQYGPTGSDGLRLLKLPFMSTAELNEQYAGYYAQEAINAIRQDQPDLARQWVARGMMKYPKDPGLLAGVGYIYAQLGDWTAARQIWVTQLHDDGQIKPGLKYMVLNNIAYADVIADDPALLPEADQYSAEAYKNAPWLPPVMGTRGTVLVELGQLDEGIQLLKVAMGRQDDPRGKALDACSIAIGEARRGNLDAARQHIDLARLYDPHSRLLERAEIALARAASHY